MLFRVFPWDREAAPLAAGGALFVARRHQGLGRHDAPHRYGAVYASRMAVSAVGEFLAQFRGRSIPPGAFDGRDGVRWSIAALDDSDLGPLVDLDDPHELVRRSLRPSEVATRNREVTQRIAERLFVEGVEGLVWWSTLEASWTNVTLFAERASPKLRLIEPPLPLAPDVPEVREAAGFLEIDLSPIP